MSKDRMREMMKEAAFEVVARDFTAGAALAKSLEAGLPRDTGALAALVAFGYMVGQQIAGHENLAADSEGNLEFAIRVIGAAAMAVIENGQHICLDCEAAGSIRH